MGQEFGGSRQGGVGVDAGMRRVLHGRGVEIVERFGGAYGVGDVRRAAGAAQVAGLAYSCGAWWRTSRRVARRSRRSRCAPACPGRGARCPCRRRAGSWWRVHSALRAPVGTLRAARSSKVVISARRETMCSPSWSTRSVSTRVVDGQVAGDDQRAALTAPDLYALLRPGGSDRGYEAELKRLTRVPPSSTTSAQKRSANSPKKPPTAC